MSIILTRRISQAFFFILFCWFCAATTLGERWWQLRGWPVNWLLELDPLVGIGTLLSTGTLYAGLIWGMVTIVLTLFLGRVFCGWLCPFGTLHQVIGYAARRKKPLARKVDLNRYRPAQIIKYWVLVFLLAAGVGGALGRIIRWPQQDAWLTWMLAALLFGAALLLAYRKTRRQSTRLSSVMLGLTALWLALSLIVGRNTQLASILLSGLLDPLPLFYRSLNLALLPIVDESIGIVDVARFYDGAVLIGTVFLTAVLLNIALPRFYCRFICPLGALLGLLSRTAVWRIGKTEAACSGCLKCEKDCEGACSPTAEIQSPECVVCLNCLNACRDDSIAFQTVPSAGGERTAPDLTRRQFVVAAVSGAAASAFWPVSGRHHTNWDPNLVRPPGALAEPDFLARCIRCGQCIRICPTNVIQPAGLESGLQALWTPVLNFRIGTSGCQYKCIACGHLCPTAAIRPLDLTERLGKGAFEQVGPIRIGTAFVDRGRCLPWAMDIPCIVCQENCPVSPKAIATRKVMAAVQLPRPLRVLSADQTSVRLDDVSLSVDRYATGDFFCRITAHEHQHLKSIVSNSSEEIRIDASQAWSSPPPVGAEMTIHIRLQQPYIDLAQCIGCGVCEHECPVRGTPAIRVTAENETRHPDHTLLLYR